MEYSDGSTAPISEKVFAPIIEAMQVKTIPCHSCDAPISIPLVVDGPLMTMLEETLQHIMDETGYTEATLKSIVDRIDTTAQQKGTREVSAIEKRSKFRLVVNSG